MQDLVNLEIKSFNYGKKKSIDTLIAQACERVPAFTDQLNKFKASAWTD